MTTPALGSTLAPLLALACFVPGTAGQESTATAAALSQLSPRVPIHTQADDPDGGAYGVWAAGRGFKASFGAGTVTVHPYGAQPQPWTWTTVSIGGRTIDRAARDAAQTGFGTDRFETMHCDGVIEAYDLRDDGVEQSFVFPTRPANLRGDLQVVGRIDSPVLPVAAVGVHGELAFVGAEGAGIRYGEAYAVDAEGSRLDLATTWDGSHITLTVPASFVANARYPLVIDPVVGPYRVHWDPSGNHTVSSIDLIRDDDQDQIYVALTQLATGHEHDLLLYSCDDDFRNPQLVFADITTSWSTRDANVATVGGARKCVTAFTRIFSTTEHALRWHTRAVTDGAMSTSYGYLSTPSTTHDWLPDVGGSRAFATGDHALIVWQRDESGAQFQNTANSRVMYALLDVTGTGQGVLGSPRELRSVGLGYDQEHPRATPMAEGGSASGWPVVWQEWGNLRGTSSFAWDGVVRRVSSANGGPVSTGYSFLHSAASDRSHCLRPSIAGESGRYMVSYARSTIAQLPGKTGSPAGAFLMSQRVDWPSNRSNATFPHGIVQRRSASAGFASGSLAYDSEGRSHWMATAVDTLNNTAFVEKLGYRGQVITSDSYAIYASDTPVDGGIAYDDDHDRFPLAVGTYSAANQSWTTAGHLYSYRTPTPPARIGIGCTTTGATPDFTGLYTGDEFAAATLTNAPPRIAGILRLGPSRGYTPLDAVGMPGCMLHLNVPSSWELSIPISTSSRGGASVAMPLPENFSTAAFYMQWILLEPGANAAGITTSEGLRVQITR